MDLTTFVQAYDVRALVLLTNSFNMRKFYTFLVLLAAVGVCDMSAQTAVEIPGGQWNSIGKGVYYDDIFTMVHWQKGLNWEVAIEESAEEPGWYRFIPYGTGCSEVITAEVFGGEIDNESYMYINATNPSKAYIPVGTFCGKINICSYVEENRFDSQKYLQVKDGVITGSDGCMAYQYVGNENWSLGNFFNGFRIVLPEGQYKDYSLKLKTKNLCSEDNVISYEIEAGPDIKTIKAYTFKGYFKSTDSSVKEAGEKGVPVTAGINTCKGDSRGRYSLVIVAYNDKDEIVGSASSYFYYLDDEADQWSDIGEATYVEDIFGSVYPDINTEFLSVKVQEHKTRSGYFRLVNPFENHPYVVYQHPQMYVKHEAHNHYIYINAEDPEAVYIEDSPVGLSLGYGTSSVLSWAWKYMCDGLSKDYISAMMLFGTRDEREITFPTYSLLICEPLYKDGKLVEAEAKFWRLTLPKTSGVEGVIVGADDAVEYYNLQGMPVVNPETGGLYIRKIGNKAEKVIMK